MEEIWKSTIEQLTVDSSYRNMFRLIENFGNRVAGELLSEAGEVIERSYSEYARMSRLACGYLEKAGGYAPGAVVGLSVESNMDWPVLFWGILMSGGIPLLLNPSMLPAQQSAILAEARAKAYVATTSLENVVVPFIHADAVLHSTEAGEERWADMVALCTSGTTGSSRVFLYDGKTIVSQLQSFNTAKKVNDDMPFIEGMPCKLLAFLPFHHVFGFSVIYMLYSCTGNTIVYLRDRTVPAVMQTCQVCGVTHLYCVPMFFNALAAGVRRKFSSVSTLPEAMKAQIRAGLLGTQL